MDFPFQVETEFRLWIHVLVLVGKTQLECRTHLEQTPRLVEVTVVEPFYHCLYFWLLDQFKQLQLLGNSETISVGIVFLKENCG